MLRVFAAALVFVVLAPAGGPARAHGSVSGAETFPSALLLAQGEPQAGAAAGAYTPPLRGAPSMLMGGGSRGISGQRRIALVIGNGAYQHLPRLANPAGDAALMATTLQSVGFQLIGGKAQTDLDRAGFEKAIRDFGAALSEGAVGLFYYAGHGVQVQGANYLVPIGANPATVADADFELIDANLVLKQMASAGSAMNIVILDACRNNPFGGRGLRGGGQGLATMRAPRGTLISYATQPGNVALDGTTGHSPYTAALADAIKRPGLQVFQVFNEVAVSVDRLTNGRQQPWMATSPLEGSFYFLDRAEAKSEPEPQVGSGPAPDAELLFWWTVAQSKNAADFQEYLNQYPTGRFAGLARNRLDQLRATTTTARLAPTIPGEPPSAPAPAPSVADTAPRPSFDCSKAQSIDETVVCGRPDLAAADGLLGTVYRSLYDRAPEPERSRVKADQIAWLQKRNSACVPANGGGTDPVAKTRLGDCFLRLTRERTAFLRDQLEQSGGAADLNRRVPEIEKFGINKNVMICGRAVDYMLPSSAGRFANYLGAWTGVWNNASQICGGLIIESVDSDGSAHVVYIYGPSHGSNSFPWKQQRAIAHFGGSENLSFQDEQGSNFVFSIEESGQLNAQFYGKSGRLQSHFIRVN